MDAESIIDIIKSIVSITVFLNKMSNIVLITIVYNGYILLNYIMYKYIKI